MTKPDALKWMWHDCFLAALTGAAHPGGNSVDRHSVVDAAVAIADLAVIELSKRLPSDYGLGMDDEQDGPGDPS